MMKKSGLPKRLLATARTRNVLIYICASLLLGVVILVAGDDIAHHIDAIEAWIAILGPWGVIAFIGLFVGATSLLVPETVLSIIAGALFGFMWGLAAIFAGAMIAAVLQYWLAQRFLGARIQRMLAARPALEAIQQAVSHDELRLQALLRLTPLNPATINYLLGASGVRFAAFLLACLAMVPNLLVEVYFGYAGKHVARLSGRGGDAGIIHDLVIFGGFTVTVIVVVLVSRTAHKAVLQAISVTAPQPSGAT